MAFPFGPDIVLRQWQRDVAFTQRDATRNVFISGGTDSGKTSGPAKHLILAYLKAGFGGLALTVKPGEAKWFSDLCREAGRTPVIFRPGSGARFNFLQHEVTRGGDGAGITINVRLLDEIAGAVVTDGGGDSDGAGDAHFFRQALQHLMANTIDVILLAGRNLSVPLMRLIVNTAPLTRQEANDPAWRESTACGRLLAEAEEKCANADADKKATLDECRTYFTSEYSGLSDRTRSVINLQFSMLARPLLTPPIRELLSTDSTISMEDCQSGAVIIADVPIQTFGIAGKICQLALKFCYQRAMLRREEVKGMRPCFLYIDECQHLVTPYDAIFHGTSRGAGNCSIFVSQSKEALQTALGSEVQTDTLLANFATKIFTRSSSVSTNEWASRLLGARYLQVDTTSISHSLARADDNGSMQGGTSTTPQLRKYVEEAEFAQLLTGGEANDFRVSAIVYKAGELFQNGSEMVPYIKLAFNQRK